MMDDFELLSAYIDGEVNDEEARALNQTQD